MNSPLTKTLLAVLLIAGFGMSVGLYTAPDEWFAMLRKPSWQPPNWVFGPVWTVLYILMGIAFARIWHLPVSRIRSRALGYFLIQMILNLAWSPLFFRAKSIVLALLDISCLVIVLGLTIQSFQKIDKIAARLLIPYLAWVIFATVLNAAIWHLN